jgi:hypothetical protein
MFSIHGSAGRMCDTASRRELLTVGGLSLIGLSLPNFLRQQTAPAAPSLSAGRGTAESVILVYLQRSPSHIEAGTAASLAVERRTSPHELNGRDVREKLHQQRAGPILPN